jgi:uncharacterized protein (TIGR02246 family)
MPERVAVAREMLDRLEAAVAAGDLAALDQLCTDDVVLFGSAAANFGPDETSAYLRFVVESNATIRWQLDRSSVVHDDGDRLLVAASGHVDFGGGDDVERSDFRLTLWLVRHDDVWLIRHFHGSIPES